MKKQVVLSACLLLTLSGIGQSKLDNLYAGTWTEKDNGTSSIKWTFQRSGIVNNVQIWNAAFIGGLFKTGNFQVSPDRDTISITFTKILIAKDSDFETGEITENQTWLIKSSSTNEIVVERSIAGVSELKDLRLIRVLTTAQPKESAK